MATTRWMSTTISTAIHNEYFSVGDWAMNEAKKKAPVEEKPMSLDEYRVLVAKLRTELATAKYQQKVYKEKFMTEADKHSVTQKAYQEVRNGLTQADVKRILLRVFKCKGIDRVNLLTGLNKTDFANAVSNLLLAHIGVMREEDKLAE